MHQNMQFKGGERDPIPNPSAPVAPRSWWLRYTPLPRWKILHLPLHGREDGRRDGQKRRWTRQIQCLRGSI